MSEIRAEEQLTGSAVLQLALGDLTQEPLDAIVNAANQHLQHGGGVAGAIVRAGGSQIEVESDEWVRRHGRVTHAEPAVTGAGRLPCRYVIHAVGPIWGQGDEDARLAAAVQGSLARADELKLASIALPAISTGIYGFPLERAAGVIVAAIRAYFAGHPQSSITLVRLTMFDEPTLAAFLRQFTGGAPA